jgi:hypothetical protein
LAIALVSSVAAGSSDGGTFTTGAIDTTGANLLVLCISWYDAETAPTISDSKSNTWTPRTAYTGALGGSVSRIYYAENPGSVGGSHTFTATGATKYASIGILAFSGAATASVYDGENGATLLSSATIQPGSVTPSVDNEVLVSCLGRVAAFTSVGSSFVGELSVDYGGGTHFGLNVAYKIQTSAGAENPLWTCGGAGTLSAAMAAFKAGGGGGGSGGARRRRILTAGAR